MNWIVLVIKQMLTVKNPSTSGKDKVTKDLWKGASSRVLSRRENQSKARSLAKDLELGKGFFSSACHATSALSPVQIALDENMVTRPVQLAGPS